MKELRLPARTYKTHTHRTVVDTYEEFKVMKSYNLRPGVYYLILCVDFGVIACPLD